MQTELSKQLLTLYAFNLAACENLMADVTQDEMLEQPSPDVNPPAWILGHLAVCTDFALQLLGQPKRLPDMWNEEFGSQSTPLPAKHEYPDREELLLALREGHSVVADAVEAAEQSHLSKANPLPMPFLQEKLPTVGDLLAHLLSTHEATHLGHLSSWRRQMGRPPLF